MKSILFLKPAIAALSEGRMLRRVISTAVQAIAVLLIVVWFLTAAHLDIRVIPAADLPAVAIGMLLLLATLLTMAEILACRADSIAHMEDSPYTVVPALSLLIRAWGECNAVLLILFGIVACLASWFATMPFGGGLGEFASLGMNPLSMVLGQVLSVFPASAFLRGLMLLFVDCLGALVSILFSYFLSEMLFIGVDIARNVRGLRFSPAPPTAPRALAMATAPGGGTVTGAGPAVEQPPPVCPGCGVPAETDLSFCTACGARIAQ